VVPLEWEKDEAGQEPAERVAPDEEAKPAPLTEAEDPERDVVELVVGDLEELIARIALEELDERLVIVAAGDEAAAVDYALRLAPQDRDLPRARPVRRVGVEAEDASLAGDRSCVVEALQAHVVEVGGPVHGRARVRLRQVEEAGLPGLAPRLRRQPREAVGDRLPLRLAQDAEPRAGHRREHLLAVLRVQLVVAIPKEGEVVVVHP